MSEEVKMIKSRECIRCDKFFDCKGKPSTVDKCVSFVERKQRDGRR